MPAYRPVRAAAAAATVLVLVAACSNTDSATNKRAHPGVGTASPDGGVQQIVVTTGNDYRFHPSTIDAAPGPLQVTLRNTSPGGAPHDLQVDRISGAYLPLAPAGATTRATFTVPGPGRYRFICTIHVRQGQTGTLVVRARA